MNRNININFNFLNLEKRNQKFMNQALLLILQIFIKKINSIKKQTYCIGERHYSNTNRLVEYEKVNTKTKKLVKIVEGTSCICGRNKSQIFTK